jgi:hypothetical protein
MPRFLSVERKRAWADYAAVADGRHLYLVGTVEAISPEVGWTTSVVLKRRGRQASYPVSSQRLNGSRLHYSATVPLEDGDEVVNGWRRVLVEATPSSGQTLTLPLLGAVDPQADDGPTSPNPPSRQTGLLHELRMSPGKPLRLKTSSIRETAMVTAVNSTITRLEVEFELVGADVASPDPARDHAELRRRDDKSVTVKMPIASLGDGRWLIEVPIEDVVELSAAKSLWDFWLVRRGRGDLRIGIALTDLRNPRPAFVYPFVPIAAAGHAWRVIPYFTVAKTLAISARWVDVEVGAE